MKHFIVNDTILFVFYIEAISSLCTVFKDHFDFKTRLVLKCKRSKTKWKSVITEYTLSMVINKNAYGTSICKQNVRDKTKRKQTKNEENSVQYMFGFSQKIKKRKNPGYTLRFYIRRSYIIPTAPSFSIFTVSQKKKKSMSR